MTSLVARSLLVGAAVLVAGAAIGLPFPGWSRAVLLGAAVWCAVLDAALVRAERHEIDAAAAPPPVTPAGPVDEALSAPPVGSAPDGPAPDGSAPDGSAPPGSRIVVGSTRDGDPVVVDADCSLVVVGTGALAAAVFVAVVAQVRARARAHGTPVRVASAPDLRPIVTDADEYCPVLPDGQAALVASSACGSGRSSVTTVVLVAGPRTVPRRWDVAIEVSRSGCAVRYPDETRVSPVSPVLPQLLDPSRPSETP